jgi:hypothetical protein
MKRLSLIELSYYNDYKDYNQSKLSGHLKKKSRHFRYSSDAQAVLKSLSPPQTPPKEQNDKTLRIDNSNNLINIPDINIINSDNEISNQYIVNNSNTNVTLNKIPIPYHLANQHSIETIDDNNSNQKNTLTTGNSFKFFRRSSTANMFNNSMNRRDSKAFNFFHSFY